MNKLNNIFNSKRNLLSVHFTAGYPSADDTMPILQRLNDAGVDFVVIDIPFSDPLTDSPYMQQSSMCALRNGMSVRNLFRQIADMRHTVTVPVVLMSYINPVMQFGMEKFLVTCRKVGISAVIIPDLPFDMYLANYKTLFDKYQIGFVPFVAPQCSDERIRHIDANSNTFIYVVSACDTTQSIYADDHYLQICNKRIASLEFSRPVMFDLDMTTAENFRRACLYANGGMTGSDFIRHIEQNGATEASIASFVKRYKQ